MRAALPASGRVAGGRRAGPLPAVVLVGMLAVALLLPLLGPLPGGSLPAEPGPPPAVTVRGSQPPDGHRGGDVAPGGGGAPPGASADARGGSPGGGRRGPVRTGPDPGADTPPGPRVVLLPPPERTAPAAPSPPPLPDRVRVTAASPELERRGRQALSLIGYPWRSLGYDLAFLGPRADRRAMILPRERRIEVYVREGVSTPRLAFDVAHEIGHAADFAHGTTRRRRRWRELRGIDPDVPWFGCAGCPDLGTPAGDFAEVFAYWQTGLEAAFSSRVAALPDTGELEGLIPLMAPP